MHPYGWDRGFEGHWRHGGYGMDYGAPGGRFPRRSGGPFPAGGPWRYPHPYRYPGGYDRGLGGRGSPAYGRFPGDPEEEMYRRERGYRGGHDAGFAEWPFLPGVAHHRHHTRGAPSRDPAGRWADVDDWGPLDESGHDDREVHQAVRESLYRDPYIDAERIAVEVTGGVVTLTGEVDEFLESRYAWDDAWESLGVRGVINQLIVCTDPSAEPAQKPAPKPSRKKK